MTSAVLVGDCVDTLRALPADSFDSLVTDPPYGLSKPPDMREVLSAWLADQAYDHGAAGFMGKQWDAFVPGPHIWRSVLRVLKPGAHGLVFASSRTSDLMGIALRLAGFEIRDQLQWITGQGFPKSVNLSKSLSQAAEQAAEHDVRFVHATYLQAPVYACSQCGQVLLACVSEQNTPAAHGVSLGGGEPSMEGWGDVQASQGELWWCSACTMSHRVFADGASGWLHRGTPTGDGAYAWSPPIPHGGGSPYRPQSIEQRSGEPDAVFLQRRAQEIRGLGTALKPAHEPVWLIRKPLDPAQRTVVRNVLEHGTGGLRIDDCRIGTTKDVPASAAKDRIGQVAKGDEKGRTTYTPGFDPNVGRFPANVIMDEDAGRALDEQAGVRGGGGEVYANGNGYANTLAETGQVVGYGDTGGASRFFYCPKVSTAEREAGCESLPRMSGPEAVGREPGSAGLNSARAGAGRTSGGRSNHHPTVKPIDLMRYLVRLVTPRGGIVLDPFTGSGSTGCAAVLEGCHFAGCELSPEYAAIARERIKHWSTAQ